LPRQTTVHLKLNKIINVRFLHFSADKQRYRSSYPEKIHIFIYSMYQIYKMLSHAYLTLYHDRLTHRTLSQPYGQNRWHVLPPVSPSIDRSRGHVRGFKDMQKVPSTRRRQVARLGLVIWTCVLHS
jgi:hypothetical protein